MMHNFIHEEALGLKFISGELHMYKAMFYMEALSMLDEGSLSPPPVTAHTKRSARPHQSSQLQWHAREMSKNFIATVPR
jgi:hypothetical protein